MWPFKKKKKTPAQVSLHTCVMKDMPWYMETSYDGDLHIAYYKIVEPYICVAGCGKRINKCLEEHQYGNISAETREKIYNDVRKRYREYLKPKAVVEDMINNILLVQDPDHLAMMEKLRGLPYSGCGTSSQMSHSPYQITLPADKKK